MLGRDSQNFEENTIILYFSGSPPFHSLAFPTRAALALTVLISGCLIVAILDAMGRLAIRLESGVARMTLHERFVSSFRERRVNMPFQASHRFGTRSRLLRDIGLGGPLGGAH